MNQAAKVSIGEYRSFFALWPDEKLRDRLLGLVDEYVSEGRPTPPQNLHLTLGFLGEISAEEEAKLVQLAGTIVFKPFQIIIDQLGYFTRPQILWAGPSVVPDELYGLHDALSKNIISCLPEWRAENFTPHITLARKAPKTAGQEIAPLSWSVDYFCLVRSEHDGQGSRYEVVQEFLTMA